MSEQTPAPSIQGMLGAAGANPVIRWQGKSYKVGHPTQAAKARLEELAADAAMSRVEAMEGRVKPKTFKAMLDRATDRVLEGDYKTWATGWQEVVWSDGGVLFLLSLLHEHHPDLTAPDAARMMEQCGNQYKAALGKVLPGFFDLLLGGREDITPEQAATIRETVEKFVSKLLPPPSPTPESTSDS